MRSLLTAVTEKAPKIWRGQTTLFGKTVYVQAQVCRDAMYDSKSRLIPVRIGKYEIVGQLEQMHEKLRQYLGWELLVDFTDFKIKCALKDMEGNIVSCQAPETTMTPEELWRFSGGL